MERSARISRKSFHRLHLEAALLGLVDGAIAMRPIDVADGDRLEFGQFAWRSPGSTDPMVPTPIKPMAMRSFAPFTRPVKSEAVSAVPAAVRTSRRSTV